MKTGPADPFDPPPEINLTDPNLYAHGDPYAVWRWLRVNDPVRWQPPGELPGFWILTRYVHVRAVYRDPATFSSARGVLLRPERNGQDPGAGRTLARTDPPRHGQLRAIVDSWFAWRSVNALEADIRDIARSVVVRAVELQTCDFVAEMATRIPLYVICKMMGIPRNDWDHMLTLTNDALGAPEEFSRRLARQGILRYLEDLAAVRARHPADDLVSALVTAEVNERKLTPDEVVRNCDSLLVGGTENTRIAAAGGMLAFLEYPAEWLAVIADPALLLSAVEEVLRWTSAATHVMRTATRPVVLGGRDIEPGSRITLWNPSANRDEKVFADPDRFNVRRHPNRHVGLGGGEHSCLGGELARAELRLLYSELLRSAERVELDGAPVRLSSIAVNGLERLPVRILPR